ncbi:MAG TPA: MFS transporter [Myxococcota bacterium]|nr:MFS transporter [Myxococcota bacterium]
MPGPVSLPFGTRVVSAAFLSQALAVGLPISAYPVFIDSIEADLGATRTQSSIGISLIIVAAALIGPRVGRLLDSGSPRVVMACGASALALGFTGLAWASSLALATLLWVVFVGSGFAMLGPHPSMTVLARWFVARRGRAVAIAAMGTTFGGALTPIAAQLLIEGFGWRSALLGFGVAAAGIGLPVVLLGILPSPESVGAHPDGASEAPPEEGTTAPATVAIRADADVRGEESADADAVGADPTSAPSPADEPVFLRDPRFWLVAAGFGLMTGISIGYVTHAVEWAGESGLARDAAVRVLVVNALFGSLGKLLFGGLVDRLGPRHASLLAVALQLAGWILMLVAGSTLLFTSGAAIFSLGVGCIIPCQAGFVGAIWGRAHFGRAAGMLGLVSIVGPFLVPVSIGFTFDRLGGYSEAMLAMGLVVAGPALAFGLVRPAPATGSARSA